MNYKNQDEQAVENLDRKGDYKRQKAPAYAECLLLPLVCAIYLMLTSEYCLTTDGETGLDLVAVASINAGPFTVA